MTSEGEQRPPGGRRRPAGPRPAPKPPSADQGDLWSDPEPGATSPPEAAPPPPAADGIDDFVSDLPPPQETAPRSVRRAAPRPVAPPPPYQDYDDYDDYVEEYSMLRNPYVLAALAVAAAIILAVIVVIVLGSGGNDGLGGGVTVSRSPTPQPGELPGVQAKVIAIAAIREGPGLEFFELGLLRNGQDVSVVGRNEDASWYQIIFAGSDLTGWVPDSALRVPEEAVAGIEVVVFTPVPKPSVEQPTPTPAVSPTATEEALGPPDIAVEILGNVCPSNGPLTVALRNVGDVPLNSRQITLTVSTSAGVVSEQTLSVTLGVGQIVPINTGEAVEPPQTIVGVVFVNEPQDIDPSNNVLVCSVEADEDDQGGGQNSTSVPPPLDETPAP